MDEATRELVEATEWLVEMANYAINHLDREWARKGGAGSSNYSDLSSAIAGAQGALEGIRTAGKGTEHSRADGSPRILPQEMGRRAGEAW